MKIKKIIVPGVIALLVIGALGFSYSQSFAKGTSVGTSQKAGISQPAVVSATQDCATDEVDGTETAGQADTDNVESQCGDQNEALDQSGSEANEVAGPDDDNVDNVQEGEFNTQD